MYRSFFQCVPNVNDTDSDSDMDDNYPFDIYKYAQEKHYRILNKYKQYYSDILYKFKLAKTSKQEICYIKVGEITTVNPNHIDVPFLQDKAAERFAYNIQQKGFECKYEPAFKEHDTYNSNGYNYDTYKLLTINLR